MFDAFLLSMWTMGRITEEQIQSYVPMFISQEKAMIILATPQLPKN